MTTQIVRYTSTCPLCEPGVTGCYICLDPSLVLAGEHSIIGNIVTVSVCQQNCNASKIYTYTISYDDQDLADPTDLLEDTDILGIICDDCFTQWVLDNVATCACSVGNTNTVCGCDTFDPLVQTGANRNTVFGYQAAEDITTGDNNIAVGYQALSSMTTGGQNVAIGSFALSTSIASVSHPSVAIGYNALAKAGSNVGCTAIGLSALANLSVSGSNVLNTAIGYAAAFSCTTGGGNVSIGDEAARYNTTGQYNTNVGNRAGRGTNGQNTSSYNTAIGFHANYVITTGAYNSVVGAYAGDALTTGSNNVAVGYQSAYAITVGTDNVSIGYRCNYAAPTIYNSVTIGADAAYTCTGNMISCISIGDGIRSTTLNSTYDIAIGNGGSLATGANTTEGCIIIGSFSFLSVASDLTNIIGIGNLVDYDAGLASLENSIAIGQATYIEKSNQVIIGNDSIIETKLRRVLLATGAAAAGSYPLKFQSGTLLTAPELGAMEFDGNHLYITTGAGRQQLT